MRETKRDVKHQQLWSHLGWDGGLLNGSEEVNFDLDGPETTPGWAPNIVEDKEDCLDENLPSGLLRLHQCLGHLSFTKLQQMARDEIIPKKFTKCPKPACLSCLYAKATCWQWHYKNACNDDEALKPTKPGEVVLVNQLISLTPGLIAQLTGSLMKER